MDRIFEEFEEFEEFKEFKEFKEFRSCRSSGVQKHGIGIILDQSLRGLDRYLFPVKRALEKTGLVKSSKADHPPVPNS